MNNREAAHLRPGALVRRKEPFETRSTATPRAILVVERVERPTRKHDTVTVHAGGQAFTAWEIERVRYLDQQERP